SRAGTYAVGPTMARNGRLAAPTVKKAPRSGSSPYDPCVDDIDRRIIDLLRVDGRATLAEIGQRVGISPPAVKRRMDRLEGSGVITGYAAVVDEAKLGRPLEAFTELRFAGDTRVADIASVADGMPEVQAVFTLAGDPDAVVWLRVSDTTH